MSSRNKKNVDRLSSLPEDVLSLILSVMPTKFAVRTSILSKTWRHKWTLVHNLDFDDIHPVHGLDCLCKFINRVLDLCKTSQIELFRLCFSEPWVKKSKVSNWIREAVRLKVCELDVQVFLLELPSCVFTCKTLTKLRLVSSPYYRMHAWKCPSPVSLPCLKTLNVAVLTYGSIRASEIINGCPVLENLSLEGTWHNEEEEFNFSIPTLKRLKLTPRCVSRINKIVLNVPNLEYLFVGGTLCSVFVMEDLSSLVEAMVSVSYLDVTFSHLLVELLNGISGAKSLSLSYSTGSFNSSLPKFPNLKHLELEGSFLWLQISKFLESSSELKHLVIKKPEGTRWIEPTSIPSCMLTSLRTVEILNYKGRECDIRFVEFMLGHAEVLNTLTIECENLSHEYKVCFHSQLLKLPRASTYVEIHFDGNWIDSTSS